MNKTLFLLTCLAVLVASVASTAFAYKGLRVYWQFNEIVDPDVNRFLFYIDKQRVLVHKSDCANATAEEANATDDNPPEGTVYLKHEFNCGADYSCNNTAPFHIYMKSVDEAGQESPPSDNATVDPEPRPVSDVGLTIINND